MNTANYIWAVGIVLIKGDMEKIVREKVGW